MADKKDSKKKKKWKSDRHENKDEFDDNEQIDEFNEIMDRLQEYFSSVDPLYPWTIRSFWRPLLRSPASG